MRLTNAQRRVLVLAVLIALLTAASDRPNQTALAARLARNWAEAGVSHVADTLAGAASLGIPGLRTVAAVLIKSRIQDRIYWTYSQPRRLGRLSPEYQVVATAIAPFDIAILTFHRRYTLSGDFHLVVNTKKLAVTHWTFEPQSFRFAEIKD